MRIRLLPLLLLAALPLSGQGPSLVRDLNPAVPNYGAVSADESEGVGSVYYFVLDDGIHGEELWQSSGLAAATYLPKDICPGNCSSSPHGLTASNGLLFFIANDVQHGFQLWKTGGPGGTAAVKDLYSGPGAVHLDLLDGGGKLFFTALGDVRQLWVTDGTATTFLGPSPGSSVARLLAAGNGKVLFAATDGGNGLEPWISDGTSAGTHRIADLDPGAADSLFTVDASPSGKDAVADPWGGFVFLAHDDVHGNEVWRTDGTAAGTFQLQDISPGAGGSSPYSFTVANGRVIFAAEDPAHGAEVWGTDGTPAGTVLLADIVPGSASSNPRELTAAGNRVFFRAQDPDHGEELWATDGTPAGTYRVRDLVPGPGDGFDTAARSAGFTNLGGKLLFYSLPTASFWTSDGTEAGTQPVPPPGGSWPVPNYFLMPDASAVAGGQLFFRAGLQGEDLWVTDGTTAGSREVLDIPLQTSSLDVHYGQLPPGTFAGFGGALFFGATDGGSYRLWKSDGTAAGTVELLNTTRPERLQPTASQLFFRAYDGLGVSDGTAAGSRVLTDFLPEDLAVLGDQALFLSRGPALPVGLWKSDGTAAGTVPLVSYDSIWSPGLMTAVGGKVFYRELDGSGFELRASDGTVPGTVILDVEAGAGSSYPDNATAAGNTLFFTAYHSGNGRELWKSDGTPGGTSLVKDIRPGSSDGIPYGYYDGPFAALPGGIVLFPADDGATGLELWRTDGTGPGTFQVADIRSGSAGSRISGLTAVGNRVFFVADDGVHGLELWVSDGTGAGTRIVKDIVPGAGSSLPYALAAAGPVLVFTAYTPDASVEAWRSDGTALGTRSLGEIAIGDLSSSPTGYTRVGSDLFFAANDNFTGFEPWVVPMSNVLATFVDVPTDHFAWRFVEALRASGISGGCGSGQYCPDSPVTRAETAVLLLTARGGAAPPPATGTRFQDVPSDYWAAPWIEQLASEGIVGGCAASPPLYCPGQSLTRAAMAVLLVGARHEAPVSPTGTLFADVPADYWAAPWIEKLVADGITGGCGDGYFCPDRPVTRAEMAVFLVTAFHLPVQ